MPHSNTGTMVVTSLTGLVGSVHDANVRERGWKKMIRRDAIGGDGIYLWNVRISRLNWNRFRFTLYRNGKLVAEEAREGALVYIRNIGKGRWIYSSR